MVPPSTPTPSCYGNVMKTRGPTSCSGGGRSDVTWAWPAGPAHQTRGVVRGTRGGGMVLNDLLQQHWHRGPENTDPFNSASQPWSLSVWFPRPSRSGRPRLASEPLLWKTAECSLGYLAQGLASSALGNEVTLGKFLNLFLPTSFSSLNRIPPS